MSLWGSSSTRYQGWQVASFLSRTSVKQMFVDGLVRPGERQWLQHGLSLNTIIWQIGLRGSRTPAAIPPAAAECRPELHLQRRFSKARRELPRRAGPQYYGDFQFARAAVNYLWAEFFGRGIVDPPNLFDPVAPRSGEPAAGPVEAPAFEPRAAQRAGAAFSSRAAYNLKAGDAGDPQTSATYQLSSPL